MIRVFTPLESLLFSNGVNNKLTSGSPDLWMVAGVSFVAPLESPGIYAGDAINRKHQLLVKAGSKPHFSNGVNWLKLMDRPYFLAAM
jgi:hypothetical protein